MTETLLRLTVRAQDRLTGDDAERGDVPGWVMITLMTAGIVAVIWGLAEPALSRLFNDAIADVTRG